MSCRFFARRFQSPSLRLLSMHTPDTVGSDQANLDITNPFVYRTNCVHVCRSTELVTSWFACRLCTYWAMSYDSDSEHAYWSS